LENNSKSSFPTTTASTTAHLTMKTKNSIGAILQTSNSKGSLISSILPQMFSIYQT